MNFGECVGGREGFFFNIGKRTKMFIFLWMIDNEVCLADKKKKQ